MEVPACALGAHGPLGVRAPRGTHGRALGNPGPTRGEPWGFPGYPCVPWGTHGWPFGNMSPPGDSLADWVGHCPRTKKLIVFSFSQYEIDNNTKKTPIDVCLSFGSKLARPVRRPPGCRYVSLRRGCRDGNSPCLADWLALCPRLQGCLCPRLQGDSWPSPTGWVFALSSRAALCPRLQGGLASRVVLCPRPVQPTSLTN